MLSFLDQVLKTLPGGRHHRRVEAQEQSPLAPVSQSCDPENTQDGKKNGNFIYHRQS